MTDRYYSHLKAIINPFFAQKRDEIVANNSKGEDKYIKQKKTPKSLRAQVLALD